MPTILYSQTQPAFDLDSGTCTSPRMNNLCLHILLRLLIIICINTIISAQQCVPAYQFCKHCAKKDCIVILEKANISP
jgi:hypothetical protein